MVKPQLTIMDGIIAMEGEGPGSGQLKKLGLVLASKDTVALDVVASRIIGLKPEEVLTTRYAVERGLGVGELKNIKIVGEKLDSLIVTDFKLPANFSRFAVNRAPQALVKFVLGQISPRPRVKKKNCTACNECVKVCPTGAVTMTGKTAVINDKLCIRCMCCHEVCRFNAIMPRRPFVGSVVYSVMSGIRKIVKM
jgi:ferredoxin